jgi:hypothetical protein
MQKIFSKTNTRGEHWGIQGECHFQYLSQLSKIFFSLPNPISFTRSNNLGNSDNSNYLNFLPITPLIFLPQSFDYMRIRFKEHYKPMSFKNL